MELLYAVNPPISLETKTLNYYVLRYRTAIFNHFNAFITITHLLSETLHNFSLFADYAADFLQREERKENAVNAFFSLA